MGISGRLYKNVLDQSYKIVIFDRHMGGDD